MRFNEILDCSVIRRLKRTKTPKIKRLKKLRRNSDGNDSVIVAKPLKSTRSVAFMPVYHHPIYTLCSQLVLLSKCRIRSMPILLFFFHLLETVLKMQSLGRLGSVTPVNDEAAGRHNTS